MIPVRENSEVVIIYPDSYRCYPLVMTNIAMENGPFISYNWLFHWDEIHSICMGFS